MEARRLDLRGVPADDADLSSVVTHLSGDGVMAYPTETVYGFGGLCTPRAVARVRSLKRRDADRPLLILTPDLDAVRELAWSDAARELASIFWPGAVTLVVADPRGIFPEGVRSQEGTVAVRMSPHPLVKRLLEKLEAPITSTSANAPGGDPARSGEEAVRVVEELGEGSDVMVLDAGVLPPSAPSTIVDCTRPVPVVLRQGSVPVNRLRCAIPDIHER